MQKKLRSCGQPYVQFSENVRGSTDYNLVQMRLIELYFRERRIKPETPYKFLIKPNSEYDHALQRSHSLYILECIR